jgi:hypothetical protein
MRVTWPSVTSTILLLHLLHGRELLSYRLLLAQLRA